MKACVSVNPMSELQNLPKVLLPSTLWVKTLSLPRKFPTWESGSSVSFLQRLTDQAWFHPNLLGETRLK